MTYLHNHASQQQIRLEILSPAPACRLPLTLPRAFPVLLLLCRNLETLCAKFGDFELAAKHCFDFTCSEEILGINTHFTLGRPRSHFEDVYNIAW